MKTSKGQNWELSKIESFSFNARGIKREVKKFENN